MAETRTHRRIHIGNISADLAQNCNALTTRLLKFGEVAKPLELHTKPINDYFFAFADMELTDKEFEKLKTAFNGIQYMGRKLTIAAAKPSFDKAGPNDRNRPDVSRRVLAKHEGIANARASRISESQMGAFLNRLTHGPVVKTSVIGATNSNLGYHISSHTTNNLSGNTKNDVPSQSLNGMKSYGSTLIPKGPFSQQYSRSSGYGEVVKGRLRKTARPASYFARKEQSLRILVNGELKTYKFHKTKLWGVEKNKTARDLTFVYEAGVWKSGDGHAVERVQVKRPCLASTSASTSAPLPHSCAISGEDAAQYGHKDTGDIPVDDATTPSIDDGEQSKNKSILAKLFNSFDFDKKLEVEEVLDEEGITYDSKGRKSVQRFDFETQGTELAHESDDEVPSDSALALVESYQKSHERPSDFTYYSEDDEGNEMDIDDLAQKYATETIKDQYDVEHQVPSTDGKDEIDVEVENNVKESAQAEDESDKLDKSDEVEDNEEIEQSSSEDDDVEESKKQVEKAQSDSSENGNDTSDNGKNLSEDSLDDDSLDDDSLDEDSLDEDSLDEDSLDDSLDEDNLDEDSLDGDSLDEKEAKENELKEAANDDDSEEEDLRPTFGPAPTSTTENLRSLFSKDSNEKQTFNIELEEDDIDEEKVNEEEEERKKLQEKFELQKQEYQKLQSARLQQRDFGLFWTHFDSPFLQQQTQLSKIGHAQERVVLPGENADDAVATEKTEEEDDYEKWFWSMRGEVSRDCRKRKKDVGKKTRKRRAYI